MKASEIREDIAKKQEGGGDDAAAKAAAAAAAAKGGDEAAKAAAAKAAADAKAKEGEGDFDITELVDGEEKVETPEELTEADTKGVNKKVSYTLEHQRKEIVRLKKELEAKPATVTDDEEKKVLKQKLAQYTLAEDEDFQKTHIAPINEVWGSIEIQLKGLGLEAAAITKLKTANVAQRAELLKGKEAALPWITPLFAEYDRKRVNAHQAFTKGEEELKRLRTDRSKRLEQDVSANTDALVAELAKQHGLLRKDEGKEAKNKRIDADIAEAKQLAIEAARDPKVALKLALLAQTAKYYPKMVTKLMAQLTDAEKKSLRIAGGRPKIGGNGSERGGTGKELADITGLPSHQKAAAIREDIARRSGH